MSPEPEKVESSQANTDSEPPGIVLPCEIWSLIVDLVCDDGENKQDLFSLCLVSKTINSLATPYLYRSVPISPVNCPGTIWVKRNGYPLLERPSKLVRRLLRDQSFDVGSLVRELRIESRFDVEGETAMEVTRKSVLRFISQDCLARLVNRLPNLERIRLEFPLPLTDKLADNLEGHRNNIDIQLIWSDAYHKSITRRVWPSVSAVCALIGCSGLYYELLELLQSCNNLRSFSVQQVNQSVVLGQSLCRPDPTPRLNQWMGPLFMMLNYRSSYGYNTWYLWEEQPPWSSLVSLTIDSIMSDCEGILGAISGRTPRLEDLKLAFDINKPIIEAIEQFMASFDTLKSFECIGWCSLRTLSSHNRLLNLKMHADEHTTHPQGWREVPRLNKTELEELSVACPGLRSLELDVQLEDGEMPWDVIVTLATKFDSLHSLSLDIEITRNAPLKSGQLILDSSDAQSIGEVFYKHKWKEFNGASSLSGFQKFVLNVRCQLLPQSPAQQSPGPQWFEPEKPEPEKPEQGPSLFVGTFEMKPPADPTHNPQVTILEPELREIAQGKDLEVTRQRFNHFS